MSTKKVHQIKPRPKRQSRGDIDLDALGGWDADHAAKPPADEWCRTCRVAARSHACPGCNNQLASRPADRRTVTQAVRQVLNSIRVVGAVASEVDAGERILFGLLLGLCDNCAKKLQTDGDLVWRDGADSDSDSEVAS